VNLAQSWQRQNISQRILRIFLGVTWIYAGWDKASDPGFLSKGAPTFIGTQLEAFSQNSPIGGLLQHGIEHATQVGIFVMLSEFAIGFATLLFIAPASAALGGFAMSTGLWLSSSFHTTPYFLASDTAYAILWLVYVLLLIGNKKMPAINIQRRGILRAGSVGALAIAASFLGKAFPKATAADAQSTGAKTSGAKASGKQIVKLANLPVGSTLNFTHSSQGIPAVLFRTKTGVFAYSAICTHEGCTVSYKSSSKHLVCPCHGASFDPAQSGAVVSGPTRTPLSKVKVAVQGAWVVEA
jgi:thiosulfate dehydrogenase [quinone] large subunit